MRRLLAILTVELKNHFSLAMLARQIRFGIGRWRTIAIAALLAAALIPLIVLFIQGINWLFVNLAAIGQESALIGLGVLAGQFIIFILGFFYVLSAFYFSNDLEILIPLPVRPNHVVIAKLAVVVINEYLTMMPVVLPILVGYAILARAPVDFWILLLPVYLLLPIIPLTLSALLAIGLMRVVNLSRRKDALIIVGTLLLLTIQLVINNRLARAGEDPQVILQLFAEKDGLIRIIGRGFPPSVWASRSLALGFTPTGLLQLLILAGTSALMFFGLVVLSERLFYQGAIGLNEIAAKRRALSRADMESAVAGGRHPLRAIFAREVKLMNRTPIFLLNGVLVVVIVPAVILIGAGSAGSGGSFISLLRKFTANHQMTGILVLTAFGLVCGCLNGTSSSAFSREGRHFWISKVIPVPWRVQIAAKLFHSYAISLIGIIVALVVSAIAFKAPANCLLPAGALALIGSAALNIAGLRIDLARPLLKWTNPQVAIKQNFNVIIAFVIDLAFMAACGFGARFLLGAGVSGAIVFLCLLIFAAAVSWIAWRDLLAFAQRKYPQIEA